MAWFPQKRESFRQPKIYSTTPKDKGIYFSNRAILIIISVIVILILFWFLFYSSYFKISSITVEGSLNPDVAAEIEALKGKNILSLVLGNTEAKLVQKQTSIETIQIRRGIPDTLKIKVFVRNPIIAWKSQDKVYLIDANGIVFEQGQGDVVDNNAQKIPTVIDSQNLALTPGGQIVSVDFVNFVKKLSDKFSAKIQANITEIKVGETTYQVEVGTDQGWRVLLDTTRNADTQLDALKKILDQYRDQIHEYVDLRVEGRAYYK